MATYGGGTTRQGSVYSGTLNSGTIYTVPATRAAIAYIRLRSGGTAVQVASASGSSTENVTTPATFSSTSPVAVNMGPGDSLKTVGNVTYDIVVFEDRPSN